MPRFLSKILGAGEGKQIKKYSQIVELVNSHEPEMQEKSDEELRALTGLFRERVEQGEELDDVLPEAFAAVREASVRTLGQRHFDVQLMGGMALNDGHIAEMKTGEGKTLVSTLAVYLNSLTGENVHVVTVNDYLAKRDSEWMGRVYRFLGLDVGLIQNGDSYEQKKPAYQANVTYGTNSEFGFDYLRDNMVTRADRRVQRGHHFAVVDEVDSILIDEARTPLIISGPGVRSADTYRKFADVMPGLKEGVDFEMDEAKRTIHATDYGLEHIESLLGIEDLYADPSGMLPNYLQQALKAQFLFHRDVDYVVQGGEVKIVDEFTGRIMEGRRFSEGLHQALEAKEHVKVREENQTLATVTLQNYFRMYDKLSGMTGTALTEDKEFQDIYKLPVTVIPPNKPVIREDRDDLIYRTIKAKFNAVADQVAVCHEKGQPVLIGTVSVETSEKLSRLLDKRGIKHETLNAKNHEREAGIIAQAGRLGAVTIATNMAGRGTDIMLGGNPETMSIQMMIDRGIDPDEASDEQRAQALAEAKAITDKEHDQVIAAGGLCVLGTERHESRRIDNQLRGRSGRQGDPGMTQFYLSLEDDLMRLFGADRMDAISRMMEKSDMPEDMPIKASMVTKAIENAQRQVETMHFAARKQVLEYDDVMNLQRQAIYAERNAILDGKDMTERISEIIEDAARGIVEENCPEKLPSDDWDMAAVDDWAANMTGESEFHCDEVDHEDDAETLIEILADYLQNVYDRKASVIGEDIMRTLESQVMLRIIDTRWMTHLQEMDYLRTGIFLRAIGQRDPLVEYKEEAHKAFGLMTATLYEDFLRTILRLQIAVNAVPNEEEPDPTEQQMDYSNPEDNLSAPQTTGERMGGQPQPAPERNGEPAEQEQPKVVTYVKDKHDPYANVGRNDPCPCGSGKKFKKCHGANRA
ncbi:MAG: preprotein translocase subunit SecA [Eggerthellaceae bacterium]|jgi:preprotein translocase subunit SecA